MSSIVSIDLVGNLSGPVSFVQDQEEGLTHSATAEGIEYARINAFGLPLIINARQNAEVTLYLPDGRVYRLIARELPERKEEQPAATVQSVVPFFSPPPIPPYVPRPTFCSKVKRVASSTLSLGTKFGSKVVSFGSGAVIAAGSVGLCIAKAGLVASKHAAQWGRIALERTGEMVGDQLEAAGQTIQDTARWTRENCPAVLGAAAIAFVASQV